MVLWNMAIEIVVRYLILDTGKIEFILESCQTNSGDIIPVEVI